MIINYGIRLKVEEVYRFHSILKKQGFKFIYVSDIEDYKVEAIQAFFAKFSREYFLIIAPPTFCNVSYHHHDESFLNTIKFYENMLEFSDNNIMGAVLNMGKLFGQTQEKASITYKTIFLHRIGEIYKRTGKRLYMTNGGRNVKDMFNITYIMLTARQDKYRYLDAALDFHNSEFTGSKMMKYVQDKNRGVSELANAYGILLLSGIGRQAGDRTSIQECTKYKTTDYIELVKVFRKSIIIFDADTHEAKFGDKNFILH